MVVQIDGATLNASFLRPGGEIDDYFTIDKSMPLTNGPALEIKGAANGVMLKWPTSRPEFALEAAARLDLRDWEPVTNSATTVGREKRVAIDWLTTNRFFRLNAEPSLGAAKESHAYTDSPR